MNNQLSQTEQWRSLPDGRLFRYAARVVIFDAAGSVLLLEGHDVDAPDRHRWWFTVGGGIETGESLKEAACREVLEETGWEVRPDALIGPVLHRVCEFRFMSATCLQDETFYVLMLNSVQPTIGETSLTAIERKTVDGGRWWSPEEIIAAQANGTPVIYPLKLGQFMQRWYPLWDGSCPDITEGTIPPPGGWNAK